MEIPRESLADFHKRDDKIVIIDYYADWCGPCRSLSPVLAQIANNNPDKILVGKINVDTHKPYASSQGVRGIPDIRIYRNGELVDKFVGFPGPDKVRTRINRQIKLSPRPPPETHPPGRNPTNPPKRNPPSAPSTKTGSLPACNAASDTAPEPPKRTRPT